MRWKSGGWMLVNVLLLAMPLWMAAAVGVAQVSGTIATTTVTDTVYHADGTPAMGTVIVSWGSFTTASGLSVPSGSTSATIGAGGALSIALAPNAGATPMGSYYTAVYHLDDGSVSREYWVVPVSSVGVSLSAIRSTVLPTSVAMQVVSKAYVDTAIAAAVTGHPLDSSTPYVLKAGDTMTGPLVLPGDPTTSTEASDKHYVDTNVTALTTGLGQKVSTEPPGTQTVAQPAGTQLQVNRLNGAEYASQYTTGLGGNGIANAAASPDCASGCLIVADPSYQSAEVYTEQEFNSGTHVNDTRNGETRDTYFNPVDVAEPGNNAGQVIDVVSTQNTATAFQQTGGAQEIGSFGLTLTHEGLTGGSNLFPASLEGVPYFKTGFSALAVTGTYNSAGQHVLAPDSVNCFGVGDCLLGSQEIASSGGFRDEADEGAHPFDIEVHEDSRVFEGTCSAGCTAGSTQVTLTPTANGGTQGEGRYLIDKNPANVITGGTLIGGSGGVAGPTATFSGTSFPVSVFLETAQLIPSQANNIAPGTVTVAIATSGVPAGFVTNTGALTAPSGVACIADRPSGLPHNYEMANYTVVDGSHLSMTLNKVHAAGSTIAVGGLCGYGLEQTVDTANGIRQVFPVIGSYSATGLYYAGGVTQIIGVSGLTSAFLNVNLPIAAIARSGNVVTVTTAGNLPVDLNGLNLTVAGVADSSYNGTFAVTTTGPNTLTYAATGANSTSSGGSISIVTGGFALYPMAEVLGVYNASTKKVDGQMTLAPNTVQWAANDAVEQPHYFQENVAGDTEFIGQSAPRPTSYTRAGVNYQANVGPGMRGWSVANSVPASEYLGNGGTHTVPDFAYEATGIWLRTFDMQAGDENVFSVHCNSHGCNKWNSTYQLFELDSSVGLDFVTYAPQTSSFNIAMRGTNYLFSPQGFTAGTINSTALNATTVNATTVNATTVTGAVSGAEVQVFGPSGSGHSQGAVPDPGAVAGASRYLREDGAWVTPPTGGGGTGSGSAALALPVTGASADYHFTDGSGGTISDATGNGNTGTFGGGSLAPSWVTNGLAFTTLQNVSLPAALNNSKTMCSGVYMTPLSTVAPANIYPAVVTSTLGTGGVNLMYNLNGYGAVFAMSISSGGANRTTTANLVSGFHVLCYVLGTGGADADQLYIDGQTANYTAQGASYGYQSSGNYLLGSSGVSAWNNSGFNGTYYRFVAWPVELNPVQIAAVSGSIQQEIASRGVAVAPVPAPEANPLLLASGTSLTVGVGVFPSQAWPENLTLTNQPAYTVLNYGISGVTLLAIEGSEPNRLAPYCRTEAGPSVYILQAGDNDFAGFYGTTAQIVFGYMSGVIQTMKQAGCRVYVMTGFSRAGTDTTGRSFDSDKNAYDAVILSGWKAAGADGVIDAGAILPMGCDGCNTNATYFQSDNTHPTAAGQLLVAAAVSNVLNYAAGYHEDNPHVVTALPYSMTAGDGYVSLSGVTGAGTLTLPDCTGQSGAVYRVNNPQSTYAVSVMTGSANQLINGLPAATAVTVPANGTLTLRDVPNAKTVSGCHWEM